MRPESGSKLVKNQKFHNDITIFWHDINVKFFDVDEFLLSSLVTGPSFISMSLLVRELWQFLFIRDLIWNLEIKNTSSEFCLRSGD